MAPEPVRPTIEGGPQSAHRAGVVVDKRVVVVEFDVPFLGATDVRAFRQRARDAPDAVDGFFEDDPIHITEIILLGRCKWRAAPH